ncbi:MAG: helix-turn-helix domain-containing protein [Melioribacteraceae bacterium]|nr:helix-turn-helix domain-containing protein [Melioribacteraceae bacterium]
MIENNSQNTAIKKPITGNYFPFQKNILLMELHEYIKLTGESFFEGHNTNINRILFICKGNGTFCIEKTEYKFNSKSVITIAKGDLHKLNFTGETTGYVLLFPDNQTTDANNYFHAFLDFTFFYYSLKPAPLNLTNEKFTKFLSIIESIKNTVNNITDIAKVSISYSLVKKLLLEIQYSKMNIQNLLESFDLILLNNFNQLLISKINISRKAEYYTKQLNVSSTKLNSTTKLYLDKKIKEIINARIIFDSKKMLSDTNFSIKEISYNMGFTDPTNFNKFFKKITLSTPKEFRNKCYTEHFNHN